MMQRSLIYFPRTRSLETALAVAGLILITPFSSLLAVAHQHLTLLLVLILLRDRFNNLELLADYRAPMILVSGSADRTAPEQRLALPQKNAHTGPLVHWSSPGRPQQP